MGGYKRRDGQGLALKTVIQFNRLEVAIHEYEMKKRGVHDDVSTSLLHSFLLTNPLEIERENRRKL